jgi:membrane protease YdiL (CAAX protease family)
LALASYAALVFVFRFGLERSSLGVALGGSFRHAFASFALLLVPLWFFGFGLGDWIAEKVRSRALRILLPGLIGVAPLVFNLRGGEPNWLLIFEMFALPVILSALLELSVHDPKLVWQDAFVLAVLVAGYMLKVFEPAWPHPGLAVLPKLYVADVALYLYVVNRRLEGMGYSFIPSGAAVGVGLREWLFFSPLGIGLGLVLGFIHFHARIPSPTAAGTAILVTFVLVAIPEELFFRTILQNLLESRLGRQGALVVAAVLFGLSHFNKGAAFNWRYVLLAAIAGIFYGRAWRARRQVLAAVIAHTAVDVVWSLWFR